MRSLCVWFTRKIFSKWNLRQKSHQTLVKRFIVVDVEQLNYETLHELAKQTCKKKQPSNESRVFNYLNNKNMIHKHAINFWLLSIIHVRLILFYWNIFNVWMLTVDITFMFLAQFSFLEQPTAKFTLDWFVVESSGQ